MWLTNAFAIAMGDKTAMLPVAKLVWKLDHFSFCC